jgi:hypothetical protein
VDLAEPRQLGKSVLVGFAVTAFFAGFAYAGRLSRKDYPVTSETLGVIAGDFNRDGAPGPDRVEQERPDAVLPGG